MDLKQNFFGEKKKLYTHAKQAGDLKTTTKGNEQALGRYTGMVCNTQTIAQREKIEKNGKQNTLAALIQKRRYR